MVGRAYPMRTIPNFIMRFSYVEKGQTMTGWNKKIGGGGIHHLSMRVHDFQASLKFYVQGLGFKEKISWTNTEGKQAVLLDTGDGNYIELYSGGQPGPKPEGCIIHFALRTDNCDAAIEQARQAGAEIGMEPKDLTIPSVPVTPVRVAFCKGPDGEVIEFLENSLT